jgi:hypothetical protein
MGQRARPTPPVPEADDPRPRDWAGAISDCLCARCALMRSDALRKVEDRREVRGRILGIAWEAIQRSEQQ